MKKPEKVKAKISSPVNQEKLNQIEMKKADDRYEEIMEEKRGKGWKDK